jgi:glycosyltransferase involved in cell wall biosynthesis
MKKISVIIPTFNEYRNIFIMLNRLSQIEGQIPNCKLNIIIIDGYSKDETINIIKKNKKNLNLKIYFQSKLGGPSIAIMDGIKKSKDQYILILDADNPVGIKDIKKLIEEANLTRLVIGSRFTKGSKIYRVSKLKIFFSILFSKLISKIFKINSTDASHSLRIFPKKINFLSKNLYHPMFFWEHTIFCARKGLIIKNVSIIYNERIYGKTNLHLSKLISNVLKAIFNLKKLLKYK